MALLLAKGPACRHRRKIVAGTGESARPDTASRCRLFWLLLLFLLPLVGCQWISQALYQREDESRKLAAQAMQAENEGEWQQAAGLLSEALQRSPRNAELHLRRARVALEQNQPALARHHLSAAEAADPENPETLVGLARIALKLQDKVRAYRLARQAVAHDPSSVPALLLQAELEDRQGQTQAAMDVYHRILALEPENEAAKIRLARDQIAAGKPDRAAVLLRSVCQASCTSLQARTDAYRQLGRAYAQAGRWDDAVAAWENVIRQPSATTADYQQLMAVQRHVTEERPAAMQPAALNSENRSPGAGGKNAAGKNVVRTSPDANLSAVSAATGFPAPQ